MKGGSIYDNSYEEKAIKLIEESIDVKEPLNQKSQEWYGNKRASYLKDAIEQLNKKVEIFNEYSKGWKKSFYGNNNYGMNMNNNKNNNSNSNSSTKKNNKNSNYNANNENISGGKRHSRKQRKYSKKTRKHHK